MHIFALYLGLSLVWFECWVFFLSRMRAHTRYAMCTQSYVDVCLSTGPLFFWFSLSFWICHKCVPIPSVAFHIDHDFECVIWHFERSLSLSCQSSHYFSLSLFASLFLSIIFGVFSQCVILFSVVLLFFRSFSFDSSMWFVVVAFVCVLTLARFVWFWAFVLLL